MMKYIAVILGIIVITGTMFYVVSHSTNQPVRFQTGACLHINWDGVESWFDNVTAKVEYVGKQNYGVRYWFEDHWSTGVGTWPFSLPSTTVECPVELEDEKL